MIERTEHIRPLNIDAIVAEIEGAGGGAGGVVEGKE